MGTTARATLRRDASPSWSLTTSWTFRATIHGRVIDDIIDTTAYTSTLVRKLLSIRAGFPRYAPVTGANSAMDRVGSGGSRALFPRDSFSLHDFSSKDFIVRDFVDHLAETAVPTNRRSGPVQQAAFDPKPLIRTFESALPALFVPYAYIVLIPSRRCAFTTRRSFRRAPREGVRDTFPSTASRDTT